MFSVTKHGQVYRNYTWDSLNKVFTTNEDSLVLDFSDYHDVTFITGSFCTFKTSNYCRFKTGSHCTFLTGYLCEFLCDENCVGIRYDVKGIIDIPVKKPILYKGSGISGYTYIEEKRKVTLDLTEEEYDVVMKSLFHLKHGK